MILASCRRKYPLEYSFSLTDEFIKIFHFFSGEANSRSRVMIMNSSQIVSRFILEKSENLPIRTLKLKFLVCFVKYSLISSNTGKKNRTDVHHTSFEAIQETSRLVIVL